jgi:hypothetical protein
MINMTYITDPDWHWQNNSSKVGEILKALRKDTDFHWGKLGTKYELGQGWSASLNEVHGGGEGDGEEYWIVTTLIAPNGETTHWKTPGWYHSYEGGTLEWESTYRVYPKPVTRLEWFNMP